MREGSSSVRSIVSSSIIIAISRRSALTGPVQLDFEREGEIAVEDARAGSCGGHAEVRVEEGEGDEGEADVESEAVGGGYRWWVHFCLFVTRKIGRHRQREREDNAHLFCQGERGRNDLSFANNACT